MTVTGNLAASNLSATNDITASNLISSLNITITGNANIGNASISNANIGTLTTTAITSGSQATAGTLTGVWTANGLGTVSYGGPNANTAAGTSVYVTGGNLVVNPASSAGIRTDNLMYANGANIFGGGAAYSNSNVAAYLPTYTGNVGTGATIFVGTTVTTGANTTPGTFTGNWTLSAGSRLQATYADLAERFEADETYDPGTVVELGGTKEITAVKFELSEDVFGVISNSAAYLMNAGAGDDQTHPPVAVSGRVHVKVMGKVEKGQRLVSAGNGIARAAETGEATAFNTIGRALVQKTTQGVGTVEAIVIIR